MAHTRVQFYDLEGVKDESLDAEISDNLYEHEEEEDFSVELRFRPTTSEKDVNTFIKVCEEYETKNQLFAEERDTWMLLQVLFDRGARYDKLHEKVITWLELIYRIRDDKIKRDTDLLELVWYCIRKGKYEEAKMECRKRNEFWRSASIAVPSSSYSDERYQIWKNCCLKLASDSKSPFEYAIYSILGGEFVKESPLIETWEDKFWKMLKLKTEKSFEEVVNDSYQSATNVYNLIQILIIQKNYAELKKILFEERRKRHYRRFGVHLFIYLKYHKENVGEVDKFIADYLQTYYITSFSSAIRREFNLLIEYFPHLRDSTWRKIIVGFLSDISVENSITIYWENCFKCLQKIRQNQQSMKIIEEIPLHVVNQIIESINKGVANKLECQSMVNNTLEWARIYHKNISSLYPIVNRVIRILLIMPDHFKYAKEFIDIIMTSFNVKYSHIIHQTEDEEFVFLREIVRYELEQNSAYLVDKYRTNWKLLLDRLKKTNHSRSQQDVLDLEFILRKYIPDSFIHTVKANPQRWQDITVEVADENSGYYSLFSKEKIKEFLSEVSRIEILSLERDSDMLNENKLWA